MRPAVVRKVFCPLLACLLFLSVCRPSLAQVSLEPHPFYILFHQAVNPLLIDVRTPREFRRNRIPGAILAENSRVLFALTDTLDRTHPLFIYCEDDDRSITACSNLTEKNFVNIYFLSTGILGWQKEGLPVDHKRGKTQQK